MKAHNSSIVGAQWSHWVRQNLLERQHDLVVETTYQITMSPAEETPERRATVGFPFLMQTPSEC